MDSLQQLNTEAELVSYEGKRKGISNRHATPEKAIFDLNPDSAHTSTHASGHTSTHASGHTSTHASGHTSTHASGHTSTHASGHTTVEVVVPSGTQTALAAIVERYVKDGMAKSGACKKLADMPRVREVVLRGGLSEEGISTVRIQNMEAILGYSRGTIAASSCKDCAAGMRPFARCIVIEGMFQGSCIGCHYNSLGAKCSFRSVPSPSPPPDRASKRVTKRAISIPSSRNSSPDVASSTAGPLHTRRSHTGRLHTEKSRRVPKRRKRESTKEKFRRLLDTLEDGFNVFGNALDIMEEIYEEM